MKFHNILLAVVFISYTLPGYSGVYKHVDEDGTVTYSNVRSSNAKKVDLPSLTVVPAIDSNDVDARIQKRKETNQNKAQRKELEDNIDQESARLSDLKNEYKDGTPDRLGSERNYQRYLDRVERLKNEIFMREANLNRLQNELKQLPDLGR